MCREGKVLFLSTHPWFIGLSPINQVDKRQENKEELINMHMMLYLGALSDE